MATIKQVKAVNKIIENRGNVSRAMLDVGYTKNSAHNPKNLTNSKGYKELYQKLGLTKNLIVTSLVEDIKAKPGRRTGELGLGADILGLKKGSGGNNTAIQVNIGRLRDSFDEIEA